MIYKGREVEVIYSTEIDDTGFDFGYCLVRYKGKKGKFKVNKSELFESKKAYEQKEKENQKD